MQLSLPIDSIPDRTQACVERGDPARLRLANVILFQRANEDRLQAIHGNLMDRSAFNSCSGT
jgi:hypothetical protein